MSRPNEGRKWKGKQPQPANRLKLSFRNGRPNFETYLYHQQTKPAVNSDAFVAGSTAVQGRTQQLRNETPQAATQRSTKRTKPAGWKLFGSSKSHGDSQNLAKRPPPSPAEQMSFRLPTSPEISRKQAAHSAENTSPVRNPTSSSPHQFIEDWETARMPISYCSECHMDQCFHASDVEAGSQNRYQSEDGRLSLSEIEFMRLNDVAALENFENFRIHGTFSNYGSQLDHHLVEPPIVYSRDLETEPYFDDPAYNSLDIQQLTDISIQDQTETSYLSEATMSSVMAALLWHRERGILWDFSPSELRCFDEEAFHSSSIPCPYSQSTSRAPPQDFGLLFIEASRQLVLYNKEWTLVQQRPTLSGAPAPSIPWPSTAPSFSRQDLYERSPEVKSSDDLPKFTAHNFFCHAFGLLPIWNFQDDSGHGICFGMGETKDTKVEKLNGLRNQLKLEKVRWHADKMKAAFGEKVANDECVKEVWGVVISLKNKVEQELESLRG